MQLTNSFNMNLLFKILENKYELKLTRANEDNYINLMIQGKKKKVKLIKQLTLIFKVKTK